MIIQAAQIAHFDVVDSKGIELLDRAWHSFREGWIRSVVENKLYFFR